MRATADVWTSSAEATPSTRIRRGRRFEGSAVARISQLTQRQRLIVDARCECDLTNKEIGQRIGLSPQTVKNYITIILARMGAVTMHGVCTAWGRYLERQERDPMPDRATRADDI